jgi:hypothetical protein
MSLAENPTSPVPDGIDAAPANGAAADEKWAIRCSGSGIRSASYCLAAMQSRQQNDLLARAKWIPAYAPGVVEGRSLRLDTRYTAPNRPPAIRLLLPILPTADPSGLPAKRPSTGSHIGWPGPMRTNTSFPAAPSRTVLTGQAARFALASIRMVNGGLALTAPGVIIGRFDEPTSDSAAAYGLRMFGIRTVLLGADLAVLTGKPLRRALGQAVIHGTDTATPALPRCQQAREAAYRDPAHADLHDTPPGRPGIVHGAPGREITRRKSAADPYPPHVYRK